MLTLMDFPDLVAVPITAPVYFNDKVWLCDVNGLALFAEWGQLKQVAIWGNDADGRDVFEIVEKHSTHPMHMALYPFLEAEASGSATREEFERICYGGREVKRRPTLQQQFGTYGRTP